MDTVETKQNRQWVANWKAAAEALDRVKVEELRGLTEEESGRMFEELAFDPDTIWISPERHDASGLVEQQRLFMKSDDHPARNRRRV